MHILNKYFRRLAIIIELTVNFLSDAIGLKRCLYESRRDQNGGCDRSIKQQLCLEQLRRFEHKNSL